MNGNAAETSADCDGGGLLRYQIATSGTVSRTPLQKSSYAVVVYPLVREMLGLHLGKMHMYPKGCRAKWEFGELEQLVVAAV